MQDLRFHDQNLLTQSGIAFYINIQSITWIYYLKRRPGPFFLWVKGFLLLVCCLVQLRFSFSNSPGFQKARMLVWLRPQSLVGIIWVGQLNLLLLLSFSWYHPYLWFVIQLVFWFLSYHWLVTWLRPSETLWHIVVFLFFLLLLVLWYQQIILASSLSCPEVFPPLSVLYVVSLYKSFNRIVLDMFTYMPVISVFSMIYNSSVSNESIGSPYQAVYN